MGNTHKTSGLRVVETAGSLGQRTEYRRCDYLKETPDLGLSTDQCIQVRKLSHDRIKYQSLTYGPSKQQELKTSSFIGHWVQN